MPRYTSEVTTADGQIKMAVKILPDDLTKVVISDDTINFAATLDPAAANRIGKNLIFAARLAAINVLDPITAEKD